MNLLQEAGDVVLAAGGPGKGVGVGCDVRRHQLGRLVPLRPTGVPNSIMVHSKAVREETDTRGGVRSWAQSCQSHPYHSPWTSLGSSAWPAGAPAITQDDSETAGCVGQ